MGHDRQPFEWPRRDFCCLRMARERLCPFAGHLPKPPRGHVRQDCGRPEAVARREDIIAQWSWDQDRGGNSAGTRPKGTPHLADRSVGRHVLQCRQAWLQRSDRELRTQA